MDNTALDQLVLKEFQKRFDSPPQMIVRAPGRVNLIGEHTDYNDGFVLPIAIDREIWIAIRPRQDNLVRLHSLDFPESAEFVLQDIPHGHHWTDYIHGMAWALQEIGFSLLGWEGVLASTIPIASGLSSSAAIELATARAFWSLTRWKWDNLQMAQAAKKLENEWLNLKSGIMDQLISACGEKDHALLIDCRSLESKAVPMPESVTVVVMDTAVPRSLIDSAYNERVEQCQKASRHFGVPSLRDVSVSMFDALAPGPDDVIYRRARHVIMENDRTLQAADAMREGDIMALSRLMNTSHESLRDDYEVSCLELNAIVDIARSQQGCLAARMTGAGFGGSAIALVRTPDVEPFVERVCRQYSQVTNLTPNVFPCRATSGASLFADYSLSGKGNDNR
jgi:galactokinase